MEPTQEPIDYIHAPSYVQGFEDGYKFVVRVIDLAIAKDSHANRNVSRLLNSAFSSLSEVLKKDLSKVMERLR